MAHDPARSKQRSRSQIIALMQQACRDIACAKIRNNTIGCPFCPHYGNIQRSSEKAVLR